VSLAAWAGFTLPSAIALILFALGIARYGDVMPSGLCTVSRLSVAELPKLYVGNGQD